METSKKHIDTLNPLHKFFILVATLTLIWFLWEQWDVSDFFYPEYWLDESKERAAILIILGCTIGIYIYKDNNEKN
ncbi:MAG: hypothetical protein CMG55_09735 [Candidatus Marinimicrobia bacterium]|nr:hypothetical protein [Candidatus Neomarinimicrobiota bacterium]|tara:strand:+ start:3270 stop:3497 length:228 start_codon:yes stop_codon:yes gene_type:complete